MAGCLVVLLSFVGTTWAQQLTDASDVPTGLSLEQESLASRFERLEAVAARLAELADSREPERAEQLRRTIRASREKGISERFGAIVTLLESESLAAAARDQVALQAELEALLLVLLEDPGDAERNAMKRFLKAQIREIGKLIRQQRSLRAKNLDGADEKRLANDQSKVGEATDKVKKALEGASGENSSGEKSPPKGGKPSDSQGKGEGGEGKSGESGEEPPSGDPIERAAQRVKKAQRAMQQAEKQLREAERKGAAEKQRQAQRDLEAARAELERILRQLREEERERLLAKLVARFRDMLATQKVLYDDTVVVHKETLEGTSRRWMLKAIRLSRREAELVRDAEKVLLLLREDGTSIAFPETASQIAQDMRSVSDRLAGADVGSITQTIELDIIAGLEDMIAALEQARDEAAQQESKPRPSASGGQPGESPLVSKLAELRMIRTLQARVYKRTQDLGALAENPQIDAEDLQGELGKLSGRQQRIFEATRDLESGANQ